MTQELTTLIRKRIAKPNLINDLSSSRPIEAPATPEQKEPAL